MTTPEQVADALKGMLSEHATIRDAATAALQRADKEQQEGYLTALVTIVSRHQVFTEHTRLGAAIRIRKIVVDKWPLTHRTKLDLIHATDRLCVRQHIINLIILEPNTSIRGLLCDALYHVGRSDFPHTWGQEAVAPLFALFQEQLTTNISAPHQLIGGFFCYLALLKARRHNLQADAKERNTQNELVSKGMSIILPIAELLMAQEAVVLQQKDVASIDRVLTATKLICKMLSYCFQQITLPYFKSPQAVNMATTVLLTIAKTSHVEYCTALWDHCGEKSYQQDVYKRRKWAFRVLNRLSRGALKFSDKKDKVGMAEQIKWNNAWRKAFVPQVLDTALNSCFELISHRHCISEAVMFPILRILDAHIAGTEKSLFKTKILPRIDDLLQAIPTMLILNEVDLEELVDSPTYFIDRVLCKGIGFQKNDVASQCYEILKALFTNKPALRQNCLNHLITLPLQRYEQFKAKFQQNPEQCTEEELLNAVLTKDVCCAIWGAMHTNFNSEEFLPNTLQFLQHLVTEHLSQPIAQWDAVPLLPTRTLWCVNQYHKVLAVCSEQAVIPSSSAPSGTITQFMRPEGAPTLATMMTVAKVCVDLLVGHDAQHKKLIESPHLQSARIQATATLERLLRHPAILEAVRPYASLLFVSVLEMIETMDNQTISVLFQNLLLRYQSSLYPVSEDIIKRLVPKFVELTKELAKADSGDFDDDDDEDYSEEYDEKFYAAQAHLSSMHTVLAAVQDSPEALSRLEQHLLPLCDYVLDNQLDDFLEETAYIIQALTYYQTHLSEHLWGYFPRLIMGILGGEATEYYEYFLLPLANFLAKVEDNLFTRVFQVTEANGAQAQATAAQLLYRLVFTHFDNKHLEFEDDRLRECSAHLLRTHIAWLPDESSLPVDNIRVCLDLLVPKLFEQLQFALNPVPVVIPDGADAVTRANAEEEAASKRQNKYALLICDSIWALITKFPTTFIPQLTTTPIQLAVNNAVQSMTLLEFLSDSYHQILPTAKRFQSLQFGLLGMAAILNLFNTDNSPNASVIRSNIVSLMFGATLRLERYEDELDQADEDDGDDDDASGGDDDYDLFSGVTEDDGDAEEEQRVLREVERQQQSFEDYQRLAREHTQASQDIYHCDYDFLTPLDNINYYRVFLDSIGAWSQTQAQAVNHQGAANHHKNEMILVERVLAGRDTNEITQLISYAQLGMLEWEKERMEEAQGQ